MSIINKLRLNGNPYDLYATPELFNLYILNSLAYQDLLNKISKGVGIGNLWIYKSSNLPVTTPTSNIYPPDGWSIMPPALLPLGHTLYLSQGRQNADLMIPWHYGSNDYWTSPIAVSGVGTNSGNSNGLSGNSGDLGNGSDASSINYIFARTSSNTPPPIPQFTVTDLENTLNGNIGIWYDHPNGVSSSLPCEWVCISRKTSTGWSSWQGPTLWSKFGKDGKDGDGVEYVYKLSTTLSIGEIEYPYSGHVGGENGALKLDITTENPYYLQESFIPVGWTDNPQSPNDEYPYQFMSMRKKTWELDEEKSLWGKFSTPVLWNQYVVYNTTIIELNGNQGSGESGTIPSGYPTKEQWQLTTDKVNAVEDEIDAANLKITSNYNELKDAVTDHTSKLNNIAEQTLVITLNSESYLLQLNDLKGNVNRLDKNSTTTDSTITSFVMYESNGKSYFTYYVLKKNEDETYDLIRLGDSDKYLIVASTDLDEDGNYSYTPFLWCDIKNGYSLTETSAPEDFTSFDGNPYSIGDCVFRASSLVRQTAYEFSRVFQSDKSYEAYIKETAERAVSTYFDGEDDGLEGVNGFVSTVEQTARQLQQIVAQAPKVTVGNKAYLYCYVLKNGDLIKNSNGYYKVAAYSTTRDPNDGTERIDKYYINWFNPETGELKDENYSSTATSLLEGETLGELASTNLSSRRQTSELITLVLSDRSASSWYTLLANEVSTGVTAKVKTVEDDLAAYKSTASNRLSILEDQIGLVASTFVSYNPDPNVLGSKTYFAYKASKEGDTTLYLVFMADGDASPSYYATYTGAPSSYSYPPSAYSSDLGLTWETSKVSISESSVNVSSDNVIINSGTGNKTLSSLFVGSEDGSGKIKFNADVVSLTDLEDELTKNAITVTDGKLLFLDSELYSRYGNTTIDGGEMQLLTNSKYAGGSGLYMRGGVILSTPSGSSPLNYSFSSDEPYSMIGPYAISTNGTINANNHISTYAIPLANWNPNDADDNTLYIIY